MLPVIFTQLQLKKAIQEQLSSVIYLLSLVDKIEEKTKGFPKKLNLINQSGVKKLQFKKELYESNIVSIDEKIEVLYTENNICPKCDGKGTLQHTECGYQWSETTTHPCGRCKGSGEYRGGAL